MAADTCAIVADDVTGAADALAPFAAAGLRAHLTLECNDVPDVDVLAVSTASRSVSASEAHARVDRAARLLRERGAGRFYKKVDSTVRGNVAVEVAALLEVVGTSALAVVCPAFPAMGRTVRDGRVLVDGQPLAGAASSNEQGATAGSLGDRFAALGPVATLPLEVVRDGVGAVTTALLSAPRIVVIDAVESRDLAVIAAACGRLDRPVVGVGSGGFAAALAGPPCVALPSLAVDRVVVLVGSLHARSRLQLAQLVARPDVAAVELDADRLQEAAACEDQVAPLAASDAVVRVLATPARSGGVAPADVAHLLGTLVHSLVGDDTCGLVVTGGDVAAAVLQSAAASGVAMLGEVAPGLPVGRLQGGSLAGSLLITKSGGFGPPGLLAVAVDALRPVPQEREA